MSESQMKKMKHALDKVAKKRSRSGKVRVGRGAVPKKAFQQAVSKAVNNIKAKTGMGYLDLTIGTSSMISDATGAGVNIIHLNQVPVGAKDTQHTNKKYLNHGSYLRGQIVGLDAAKANSVALVWILDQDPTGVLPQMTDIFMTSSAAAPNVFSQLNPAGSARFRVLARRNYNIQGDPNDAGASNSSVFVEEYINLKNFETVTKGVDDGSIATIQKNALYLCLLGSSSNIATADSAASFRYGTHRLQFLDQ